MTPTYLALDLETTGLRPNRDRILEVGVIILTEDLEEIGTWSTTIQPAELPPMDDYVRNMHLGTGLLAERDGALHVTGEATMATAAEGYLIKLAQCFPEKPILLGSSLHFDRSFLASEMRGLLPLLHHRHLDASAAQLALPWIPWPEMEGTQRRALDDARHSLRIIRHVREYVRGLEQRMAPRKKGKT